MTVGVDTWVTIVEADAYLTNRAGAASWFTLGSTAAPGTDSKTLFLVSAFNTLRTYTKFSIPKDSTDENVKSAQCETAYYLLNYFGEVEQREVMQGAGVSSFEFSKRKEQFTGDGSKLPQFILKYLVDYQTSGAAIIDLMEGLLR